MSPESIELARMWLAKARSDLGTARLLIKGEEKHLDTRSYHCHQTAEKALKAGLTLQDVLFPKTHDLEALVHLGIKSDPKFSRYLEHARALTPFATEFRYPGDLRKPEAPRAEQALKFATEIFNYCDGLVRSESEGDSARESSPLPK